MLVAQTREDFRMKLGVGVSGGFITIRPKRSASELHSGHEHLINYCKQKFDKVAVNFFDPMEFVSEIYAVEPWFQNYVSLSEWDRDGCLAWCAQKGVDLVVAPLVGVIRDRVRRTWDMEASRQWVDQIWTDNGYPQWSEDECPAQHLWTLLAKSIVLWNYMAPPVNIAAVTSWKNGEIVFIVKDFVSRINPSTSVEILDPVRGVDGLYYSSSHSRLTDTQRQVVQQFEPVVDSIGYQNREGLIQGLGALDMVGKYSIGLKIVEVAVTEGGVVGEGNVFINITYTMNGLYCYYPIFKRGA